jgi:DNA invertase Pin-like site-specific DNA recombinase
MLTVLGGLAEFERELIRARTGEGRQRARARACISGESRNSPRKSRNSPRIRREALARRQAGEPLAEIARSYDVHHSTISRLQP